MTASLRFKKRTLRPLFHQVSVEFPTIQFQSKYCFWCPLLWTSSTSMVLCQLEGLFLVSTLWASFCQHLFDLTIDHRGRYKPSRPIQGCECITGLCAPRIAVPIPEVAWHPRGMDWPAWLVASAVVHQNGEPEYSMHFQSEGFLVSALRLSLSNMVLFQSEGLFLVTALSTYFTNRYVISKCLL